MDKKQAAEFLGVSQRMIERYTQSGEIGCTYIKQGRVNKAIYDEEELRRFKERREKPIRPSITTDTPRQSPTSHDIIPYPDTSDSIEDIVEITRIFTIGLQQIRTSEKLVLTLKECQLLTGLSRKYLLDAIASKKLKAKYIGRGWKITRIDLKAFTRSF